MLTFFDSIVFFYTSVKKVLIIIFYTKACVFKNVYVFISIILSTLTMTVYRGL